MKSQWSHIIFFDDATLIYVTDENHTTSTELCKMVQQNIKSWNKGLTISGEYLNGKNRITTSCTSYSIQMDNHILTQL